MGNNEQENLQELIEKLGLEPLPVEGGLFRQTYKAVEKVSADSLPARYWGMGDKPISTAIYYLLTDERDSFSMMHRLPTDEIYHFYLGDPVEMLLLYPEGRGERVRLGQDVLSGEHVQFVAPAGVWQGSYLLPGGQFALMGTTMAPGYTDEDFEGGVRGELVAQYPDFVELIEQLTRAQQEAYEDPKSG